MKRFTCLSFLVALLFTNCSGAKNTAGNRTIEAAIVKEGFIDCFEKNLSSNGAPVWCETSAILYDNNKLLLANDKDMPGNRSPVFSVNYTHDGIAATPAPFYFIHPLLKYATKYEDFAKTPDNQWVILSTGFDRVKPGSTGWNNFNTILYWPAGDDIHPKVLTAPGHEQDSSSISLRPLITQALVSADFPSGPPYFKIEGLAATANRLFFGIREEGLKYDSFKYKIKILTVPYKIENGSLQLNGSFSVLTDLNIDSLKPGKETIALSSIEYDPFHKRFLLLTSYEEPDHIGGYLWAATENNLRNNRIYPVKTADGQPVHFHNKSEDLAIIHKNRIIVIHDDDRQTLPVNGITRQPYQAAYSIVDFK